MRYYKLALHKRYFDTGLGLTNYFKLIILIFGVTTLDLKNTLIMAFVYAVCCYFLGWLWINKGFYEAENEVSNQFNLFQKEVRAKLTNRKV